ncbi:hypothetical protein J2810_004621 [Chryseobacterium rhizosphaerae]|uniref:hypothetical protein n=1 Tax=Chryseobacterium rhizosphaerae TaxID=395937 RepID=UPI00285916C3|nr:hypothetical protein [Chryseobacterium rhizosphaerae]MDR6548531.1 hypothetical protein [Chryseobacterium rhizosphaerae]
MTAEEGMLLRLFAIRIFPEKIRIAFLARAGLLNYMKEASKVGTGFAIPNIILCNIIAETHKIEKSKDVLLWYLEKDDPSNEFYEHSDRKEVSTLLMMYDLEIRNIMNVD